MPRSVERVSISELNRKVLAGSIYQGRPLIIRDMLDGQAIREIATIEAACERWGDFWIVAKGSEGHINHTDGELQSWNFGEFLTSGAPQRKFMRFPDADLLGELYDFPDSFDMGEAPIELAFGSAVPTKEVALTYGGGTGAWTHLHYDANARHNLMYHLFGRKRWVLFGPESTKFLGPHAQSSLLHLNRLSAEELDKFIDYAGGYDEILEAGETLLVPAFVWHFVTYLEPSMSFSARFGLSPHLSAMFSQWQHLHPTAAFQLFGSRVLGHSISAELAETVAEIQEVYRRESGDGPFSGFWAVESYLDEYCRREFPDLYDQVIETANDREFIEESVRLTGRSFFGNHMGAEDAAV